MNSRNRVLLMLPVLAIATWLALFGDKTPEGEEVVAPVAAPAGGGALVEAPVDPEAGVEDPAITGERDVGQIRRVGGRAGLVNEGEVVDLFAGTQQAGGESSPEAAPPPPPPEAPPRPFVLIGRMFDQGQWVVFLEREGRTHVLRAREVAEGYRVDALTLTEIRLTQLVDNSRFVIPIDGEKKEP